MSMKSKARAQKQREHQKKLKLQEEQKLDKNLQRLKDLQGGFAKTFLQRTQTLRQSGISGATPDSRSPEKNQTVSVSPKAMKGFSSRRLKVLTQASAIPTLRHRSSSSSKNAISDDKRFVGSTGKKDRPVLTRELAVLVEGGEGEGGGPLVMTREEAKAYTNLRPQTLPESERFVGSTAKKVKPELRPDLKNRIGPAYNKGPSMLLSEGEVAAERRGELRRRS